ncbi:hypothetical protein [Candidatus Pelagibacter communis]|uniref:hypothetical protein n=1 Tax=Pelagibacter ubique TaxID=198252 RepID=UPI00092CF423|nr:hypothetical protein [Candidatus Pelagibacter ubique]
MKKYYLFIILLLFTQCDYKPIYSKNNQNFGIKIIEFNENRSNKILATRLENYSYEKNNIFLYELKLLTSEKKLILSKDTKGDPLLLGLKINLKIEVYEKDKLITKKEYNEQFNYQNLSKKFELNSYESEIRSNIYNKMISKILIDLTNLK